MGDASPRGETTEKSVFSTRVEFFAWANSLMTGVFSGESSLGFCFAGIAAILITLARARTRRLSRPHRHRTQPWPTQPFRSSSVTP